jgi:Flp pilus assembly pilin Flp
LKDSCLQESGKDLVEHALIAALIAVVCVAAAQGVTTGISSEFIKVSGQLT